MKKKILWIIAFALAAVMSLSLAACGPKGDSGKKDSGSDSHIESPVSSETDSDNGSETGSDSDNTSESDSTHSGELGTKNNPYIIKTVDDLLDFADRINNPEDSRYSSSCFRLGADIDMAGEKYTVAGKPVDEISEDGSKIVTGGFSGSFDGNGHKITNLTITQKMRKSNTLYYMGLFGYTNKANIFDLTVENISYDVESMTGESSAGVYIGGIVGYAVLTNFVNVNVSGKIETRLLEKNIAYIGSIAGEIEVYNKTQAYIAYVRNCVGSVETVVGNFDDGQPSDLESAANGGLIGSVSCSKGALAIVNSVAKGKVYGGEFVGGIVGYASGSNVSIINCINYAMVRATAKEVAYAGGIIGSSRGDMIVLDCYSEGNVTGAKANSATYKSYTGGIFGYNYGDDYEEYYTAGVVAENVYYGSAVRTGDVINDEGTKVEKTIATEAWFVETLGFVADEWMFEDGKALPKASKLSGSYKLSLYADGKLVKEIDKPYSEDGFSIVGVLDDAENNGTNIFFDWAFVNGTRYRYYLPVVKDIRLDAKYGDISALVGTYKGTGEFHGNIDAGVLVLNADGTLQWVNSTVVGGKFKTDGTHIQFTFNNTYGDVTGSYSSSEDAVKLTIEHGMSATVEYTFKRANVRVFGQYFNESGDMFAFTDSKLTLYSEKVNNNNGVSATYTISGDELYIEGKLDDYFSSMKITILADGSLDVKFAGTNYSLDCNFARPESVDHTGEKYIGKFSFAYLSSSGDGPYQSDYTLEFAADGTLYYSSKYSTTPGTFYLFGGNMFKVLLGGNISTFYYDEANNIFFGAYNGGTSSKKMTVLTPVEDGALKAFMVGTDENTYVAVNDKKNYVVTNGELDLTAVVNAPDGFADGARITVNGQSYRVKHYIRESRNNGFGLTAIGKEEGEYTYNGKKVILDGIGNVSGDKSGVYALFDNLLVVIFDDDEILGFDYASAKLDNGKITAKTPDKNQGVWYEYQLDDETDPENPVMKKFHKLIIDGFGHATYVYNRDYKDDWVFNWGGTNQWRTVTERATGLYIEFNENYKVEFNFYYDRQLAYCKNFGNVYKDLKLTKEGYTGTTDLPVLPFGVAGMYSGVEKDGTAIVFNLKQDLTGSVKGSPLMAIYDGNDTVFFKVGGVSYVFSVSEKTLSYGSEVVALTRGGDVEEVIPAMFVGTWSGIFTGYGTTTNDTHSIAITADGTMTYGNYVMKCVYDVEKSTITGVSDDGEYKIVMTWNQSNANMSAIIIDDDPDFGRHDCECSSMTKA